MAKTLFQNVAVAAASTVAGIAMMGVISAQPAQAITLTYDGEINVFSNLDPNPLLNSAFSFSQTPVSADEAEYTLLSFDLAFSSAVTTQFPFLNPNYSLADLSDPIVYNYLNNLNSTYIPIEYQGILGSIASGSPFLAPYISIPSSYSNSYGFGAADLPVELAGLFPQGGTATLSLNQRSAAVPEPTTMAGLALAGAGLTAARRRRQAQKANQSEKAA